MPETLLKDRDYTIIVAKSESPVLRAIGNAEWRWVTAQLSLVALARKCEEMDPDGITIYISSNETQAIGSFKKYERVSATQIDQVFLENHPPASLDLAAVLQTALCDYFVRKAAAQGKPNGGIIIVMTDGEPDDRMAIAKAIVEATQKMERDEELGVGFVQVGDDAITTGFLHMLNEDLQAAGAKFDIVHTDLLTDLENTDALTQFLLDIVQA